jgi:hypothetical protein
MNEAQGIQPIIELAFYCFLVYGGWQMIKNGISLLTFMIGVALAGSGVLMMIAMHQGAA